MSDMFTLSVPFLFVFAVVYGSLDMVRLFRGRGVNAIIAVIFAFFAISSPQVIDFIFSVLPYGIAIFVIAFLLGFLKKMFSGERKSPVPLLITFSLILIYLASGRSGIELGEEVTGIVVLIIIGMIFYGVYNKQ